MESFDKMTVEEKRAIGRQILDAAKNELELLDGDDEAACRAIECILHELDAWNMDTAKPIESGKASFFAVKERRQSYKVTYNYNVRAHLRQTVFAPSAQAAIEKAIDLCDWEELDTAALGLETADAEEPTFWADPVDPESGEPIADEHRHPQGYVYKSDLLRFAKKVANFSPYGEGEGEEDIDDAAATLNGIIALAKTILEE